MDTVNKLSASTLIAAMREKRNLSVQSVVKEQHLSSLKYCYGFSFGRQALYALFKAKKWKIIAIPMFACPIIPQAVRLSGSVPIFIDVDQKNFQISPIELKKMKNVDAVVVIHPFGYPVDVDKVRSILPSKTVIIEDCAHALGSKFKGKMVGSAGDYALFSLYKQVANINGAILASQEELAIDYSIPSRSEILGLAPLFNLARPILNYYRKHSRLPSDENKLNFKPSPPSKLSLNLFSQQIMALEKELPKQIALWEFYNEMISHDLFDVQEFQEGSNAYNFTALLKRTNSEKRDELLRRLRKEGLFIDRVWHNSEVKKGSNAWTIVQSVVNLPINPQDTKEDVSGWIKKINATADAVMNL